MKREDGQSDGQRAGTQQTLEGADRRKREKEKKAFPLSPSASSLASVSASTQDHFLFLSFSKFVGRFAIVRARGDFSRETGPLLPPRPPGVVPSHGARFIN